MNKTCYELWQENMGAANTHTDNAAAQIFLALANIGRTLAIIADQLDPP